MRAGVAVVSSCVAAMLIGGCGAGDDGTALPAAPSSAVEAVELSAAAVYGRHAAVRGKVDVRLTNEGEREVEVVSYRVRHPMWEQVPATQRESRVAPGATVLRPVDFGAPLCDVTDPSGAVVDLEVRGPDGVTPVAVPLPDDGPGLVRAHEVACAAEAAADVAVPEFGDEWVADGEGLRSTLSLRRPGGGTGEAVAVTAVSGSILFSVQLQQPWPLTLDGDAAATEVPVLLTVARCDPHALIESKTAFTFPVSLQIGDAEPVPVQVTVGDDGRRVLQELLDRTCGLAPTAPSWTRPASDPGRPGPAGPPARHHEDHP